MSQARVTSYSVLDKRLWVALVDGYPDIKAEHADRDMAEKMAVTQWMLLSQVDRPVIEKETDV